jgi:hypothetical protein
MNPQQHFFQSFFGPQQQQIQRQVPEYIIHNETILEIMNNWNDSQNLMNKYKEGKVKQVDQMQQTWLNFLLPRSIDITIFKNEQEFFDKYWIIPNN